MTAPQTDPTAPAYTSRTLPAHWQECVMCGQLALPDLDGYPRCPSCAALERVESAAEEHLAALLAPQLAAWAQHYAAQLYDCFQLWAGAWMNPQAQQEHLTALLTDAGREYPAPSFTPSPPARVQLDVHTMPQILAAQIDPAQCAASGPGEIDRRLTFTVREVDGQQRERIQLSPGCDVLLILNAAPEGEALLCYTGIPGAPHLRVPARLLPQMRDALGYWAEGEGGQA
ncbi:hypothetical protein [Deinococcus arenicola]|uniref:Uncharacterized protein n=1 Tax=Deinococcus arenicola TaxID=2994950 RepID=A0ABU4DUJ0_9DEIO|nr:hypothetical protein [Deinococcus sp. ZS9-10]MDV6376103.1 hypothetical protein [Deinococcus sp. ZS9-10]